MSAKMFTKVMIANRGEIACRIARTCSKFAIETVGIYSDQDKFSMHTHAMDQSFLVGPSPSAQSYLRIPHIIEVAEYSKAQAVHPG
jgi:acetyl/propionyl-CoA carboxylase alpha subunit